MTILSIITVCRNEEARIQRTIDSIMYQSDQSFEWIVVDGASTDDTLGVLQRNKPSISRLITEPDLGIYDAMNKGILAANGQFVLFLNAGDRLENADVVRFFRAMSFRVDMVVGDIRVVYANGSEQYRKSKETPLNRDYLYWRSFPHPSTFIKRALFGKLGLYDISFQIAADWEFFTRVITRHNVSVASWPHCVAVFTNDGISASIVNRKQLRNEGLRIRRMHYPVGYRWRRNCNEAWGAMIHCIRQRLRRYCNHE